MLDSALTFSYPLLQYMKNEKLKTSNEVLKSYLENLPQ